MLQLYKYVVWVLVTVHWGACYLAIVPLMNDEYPNWYEQAGYANASPLNLYIMAFEYALLAIVVGYGVFTPANPTERFYIILFLM